MGVVEMTDLPIEYVNGGLANCFSDRIVMNKALLEPKWKVLHKAILIHEQNHEWENPDSFSGKGTLWISKVYLQGLSKDVFHELFQTPHWLVFKFAITHHNSWSALIPVSIDRKNKDIYVDYGHIIIYFLFILFTWGTWWAFKKW